MDHVENIDILDTIDVSIDLRDYFKNTLVPNLKKLDRKENKSRYPGGKDDDVSFHPLYKKMVKQATEIKPHAEPEYFPESLFRKLSPRQREDEFCWLRDNYEPFTQPIFVDFMNTIKRGVNPKNHKINFPNVGDEDNTIKDYCTKHLPEYKSIHTWFSNTCFDYKLKDANGIFAVKPKDVYFRETSEGNIIRDDEFELEPIPVFYKSKSILCFKDDDHALVMSEEKSVVSYANKLERTGYVMYLYTRDAIYIIEQVGNRVDWEFNFFEWFRHDYGTLPCWKAKGMPRMIGDQFYYQSPYFFAVGPLNTMLKNAMVLEMSNVNVAFPYRIMVADECDFRLPDGEQCFHGKITIDGREGNCPSCNGTGLKEKPSAGGTMLVNEAEVEGTANLDRIRFVSPETSILDWQIKKVQIEEQRAKSILHLRTSADQATGDVSATGRLLDMNSTYAFMMPILEEGFDILENVLNAIMFFRYGPSEEDITIARPVDLDYKTTNDYLEEYKQLQQNGAPNILLVRALDKYIHSLFYGTNKEEKMWKLIIAADTLAPYSNEEVRNLKGAKLITNWQAVLHFNIFNYLDELMQDESFLDKDLQDQKQMLIEMAKREAPIEDGEGSETSAVESILGQGG